MKIYSLASNQTGKSLLLNTLDSLFLTQREFIIFDKKPDTIEHSKNVNACLIINPMAFNTNKFNITQTTI